MHFSFKAIVFLQRRVDGGQKDMGLANRFCEDKVSK